MSANFYELLKYAATGTASPDMTYFDKLRASTLMGGAVQTLTGIPPLSFKSDGSPLISWSMKGNGSQTGTPTPDNPVMPEFVGVRTGNLWDLEQWLTSKSAVYTKNGDEYTITSTLALYSQPFYFATENVVVSLSGVIESVTANNPRLDILNADGTVAKSFAISTSTTKSENISCAGIRINWTAPGSFVLKKPMLNLGSTALPYEPYGYKIPLTNAGQTVPVYLGQTQTVRRVKKLVLTSTTVDWTYDSTYNRYTFRIADSLIVGVRLTPVACSHFVSISDGRSIGGVPNNAIYSNAQQTQNNWFIKTTDYTTASSFKQFLDDELAAGNPVTVWYVLAEPTTGIVNEPLAKIGDYADELHSTDAAVTIPTSKGSNTLTVDTELQPSEMTITFKG